jgi:hypothetical protein
MLRSAKMMTFKDFLQGVGSVLTLYPPENGARLHLPQESDEDAIRRDWETVGNDIRFGIEKCDSGEK